MVHSLLPAVYHQGYHQVYFLKIGMNSEQNHRRCAAMKTLGYRKSNSTYVKHVTLQELFAIFSLKTFTLLASICVCNK